MSFYELDNYRLHYEIYQNTLPYDTLFLHGNLASLRWWYPSLEIWQKANDGKNLRGSMILLDWRGCGKSDAPQSESDMEMGHLGRDVNRFLKSLNVSHTNVIGHSSGGMIAMKAASQEPGLYNKLVLLDSVGPRGVELNSEVEAAFDQMAEDKQLTADVIQATIHNPQVSPEFLQDVVVEDAFQAIQKIGKSVVMNLKDIDCTFEFKSLRHPTLVLHGDLDMTIPVADSQLTSETLPNAKLQILENQGHCCNVENPALFVELTNQFLFSVS